MDNSTYDYSIFSYLCFDVLDLKVLKHILKLLKARRELHRLLHHPLNLHIQLLLSAKRRDKKKVCAC